MNLNRRLATLGIFLAAAVFVYHHIFFALADHMAEWLSRALDGPCLILLRVIALIMLVSIGIKHINALNLLQLIRADQN